MHRWLVARVAGGHRRCGKGASGQAAALRLERSARCADCPAMLGLAACRITRYVRFAHCAQTHAASQRWMRAARAAASPALLGAPEALRDLPGRAFAPPVGVLVARTEGVSRQARQPRRPRRPRNTTESTA